MVKDKLRDFRFLLCLLQVNQEYLHQISEHCSNAYLSIHKITSPPP